MNFSRSGFIPFLTAAAALAAFAVVLIRAISAFHQSVDDWSARDLSTRTELAARAVADHYSTGDIGRIRSLGDEYRARGTRLTLFGRTGKPIYDSHVAGMDDHADRPEIIEARKSRKGTALRMSDSTHTNTLYCAREEGGIIVRLAVPYDGLIEPVRKAHTGLLLAGFAGACGLLVIFLFTDRLAARARALARERDENARRIAEMERREEFRRDFVANVTHEIKTPITGILAAADMLSDASLPESDKSKLLDLLKHESRRIDSLAHDVLDLARLENERSEDRATFSEVDLTEVLDSVRARLQPRADAANVKIRVDAKPPLPFTCDAALVEQAMSNLADNALKYSGSPEIVLSASMQGGHAVLAVEDHGTGIPEEHRARIFERFYRVDKDRSRTCGGTGLGLAIVKHIARLHGGEASLSAPENGGCRFELTLFPQSATRT